jgi:predicted TIM-barrel fold metal-dependent hydrolase
VDYKFFSSDDHLDMEYLPADLWTSRVTRAKKEEVPHRVDTPQGKRWLVAGEIVQRAERKFGKLNLKVDQSEGNWRPATPKLRLSDMDQDGVEGQVLYNGLTGLNKLDPELLTDCIRAFNDWNIEFAKVAPGRLLSLGYLPTHSGEAAAAEVYHCAKGGLKGVQFLPFEAYRPVWHGMWEPVWKACNETGLSVGMHLGGGQWSTPRGEWAKEPLAQNRGGQAMGRVTVPNQLDEALVGMVMCGAFDRNPRLKVVIAECSIGWIPFILERMDRKYAEMHPTGRDDAPDLKMKPSEYWHQHMYGTFQEDPVGIRLLDLLGPNTVCWASDYPHPDSTWPVSHKTNEEVFKDVDPKIVKMILRDNTRKLYVS